MSNNAPKEVPKATGLQLFNVYEKLDHYVRETALSIQQNPAFLLNHGQDICVDIAYSLGRERFAFFIEDYVRRECLDGIIPIDTKPPHAEGAPFSVKNIFSKGSVGGDLVNRLDFGVSFFLGVKLCLDHEALLDVSGLPDSSVLLKDRAMAPLMEADLIVHQKKLPRSFRSVLAFVWKRIPQYIERGSMCDALFVSYVFRLYTLIWEAYCDYMRVNFPLLRGRQGDEASMENAFGYVQQVKDIFAFFESVIIFYPLLERDVDA